MALNLRELKTYHDKAYDNGQVTRDNASDDLVFAFINQWDADYLTNSTLGYRGEFDVLIKGIRQVISDLSENPIQIDFEPVDQERDDAAELLDGIYRTDDQSNTSIEAYENAKQETVACGVGAWEIFTEYSSLRSNNKDQVIKRRPIFEACNTVMWDPNSKLLDKSDAKYVSVLTAYSEDGYKELVKELTGEEQEEILPNSFKDPNISYTFPWIRGDGSEIYVTNFYFRKKIKTKLITMINPVGDSYDLLESNLDEITDDMIDEGWNIDSEKDITVWQVTKYIASGAEILNGKMVDGERVGEVIAGEYIPVVPCYGQHAIVEGQEHYEGLTRRAKDPQRLRNFALSYVADIVSRSPRPKPIYFQEQIAGFEDMYSENGIDDNYPYKLMQRTTPDGQELPLGPIGMTPEQPMPQALAAMIELTKGAVEDVANSGMPAEDATDPDASGKAIKLLQSRIDQQATIYQHHFKHSKRHDGVIYASIAAEIYDVPRKVTVTRPDGTKKNAEVMQTVVDAETGKIVVLNNLADTEFNVYSTAGPSYTSQKEQTQERLSMMIQGMPPGDPKREILELQLLESMDGVEIDDLRVWSRNKLILQGVKKPDTPEEEQMLKEAQETPQPPSADMVLAMAEDKKGQAALQKNEIELVKVQTTGATNEMKTRVDAFEAQLEAQRVQIEAQKANAEINNKEADTMSKQLDNIAKEKEGIVIPEISHTDMSDDELYDILLEA